MKRLIASLVALVVAAAASACAGGASQVAAVVNGTVITRQSLFDDVAAFIQTFPEDQRELYQGESGNTYNTSVVGQVLGLRVMLTLIDDEVEGRGLSISPEAEQQGEDQLAQFLTPPSGQPADLSQLPSDVRDRWVDLFAAQITFATVLASEPTEPISDEEVRRYYDENFDRIMAQYGGQASCLSHILVAFDETQPLVRTSEPPTPEREAEVSAEAAALAARIAAGEDFAAVAAAESDDTETGTEGGDIGCWGPDAGIGEEFDRLVVELPVGQVSDPVRTDFGYHLLLVRSRGDVAFEEIADAIRSELEDQRSQTSPLQAWIEAAVAGADVEVNPQFGTYTPEALAQGGQLISPPEGPLPAGGADEQLVPPFGVSGG